MVKSDYIDNEGIAEQLFITSSSSKFLGYDVSTTLDQIIDDYPNVEIEDLEPYELEIAEPKLTLSDKLKIGTLSIGFDEKTYTETPIYKTVRKYNYYSRSYYDDKEFVRMEKKIRTTSPITYLSVDFVIQSIGKAKGKALASSIKSQAIKIMKVTEIENLDVINTDLRSIYLLKNNDLMINLQYYQDKDDENAKPNVWITVVTKNFDYTFEDLATQLTENFNRNED